MKIFFITLFVLCCSTNLIATPDLFVEMNEIHMESKTKGISIEMELDEKLPRLSSIIFNIRGKILDVPQNYLNKIWFADLQKVEIIGEGSFHQLNVDFRHFSPNGLEPSEGAPLDNFEFIIRLTDGSIRDIIVKKDGNIVNVLN